MLAFISRLLMVRLGAGSWLNLFCSISLVARFRHILVSLWAPEPHGGPSRIIAGPSFCCILGWLSGLGVLASAYPMFLSCEV